MATRTLTIELPDTADIPLRIRTDQDLLRYAIAGALYACGLLSDQEARNITGDPRQVFEEKVRQYGFALGRPRETTLHEDKKGESREKKGRWALAAEHFRSNKAGHLHGKSDEVMEYVRDFRKGFAL